MDDCIEATRPVAVVDSDRHAELLTTLAERVDTLRTSEGWLEWLKFAGRFRSYSLKNQLLLLSQRSDATRVAGYRQWQALGRQVRKGEQAIRIFAPIIRKGDAESERVVVGFRLVPVFDIAQTEGDPLPELTMPDVRVTDLSLFKLLVGVATAQGFSVEPVTPTANGARGWWNEETQTIALVGSYSIESQCRTLLHELGHALDTGKREPSTRAELELVAESVAYVVGEAIGIDTTDASTVYLASWGADSDRIAAIGQRVLATADRLTAAIDTFDESNGWETATSARNVRIAVS